MRPSPHKDSAQSAHPTLDGLPWLALRLLSLLKPTRQLLQTFYRLSGLGVESSLAAEDTGLAPCFSSLGAFLKAQGDIFCASKSSPSKFCSAAGAHFSGHLQISNMHHMFLLPYLRTLTAAGRASRASRCLAACASAGSHCAVSSTQVLLDGPVHSIFYPTVARAASKPKAEFSAARNPPTLRNFAGAYPPN